MRGGHKFQVSDFWWWFFPSASYWYFQSDRDWWWKPPKESALKVGKGDKPYCYEPVKLQIQGMWSEWSHERCGRPLIFQLNALGYDASRRQWGWFHGYDAPWRICLIPWIWRTKTDRKDQWILHNIERKVRITLKVPKIIFQSLFYFNRDYNFL